MHNSIMTKGKGALFSYINPEIRIKILEIECKTALAVYNKLLNYEYV